MNDTLIVTVSVVLDDRLRAMGHRTDCRAQTSDSPVLTVGVIAACQARCWLHSSPFSASTLTSNHGTPVDSSKGPFRIWMNSQPEEPE